MIECLFYEDGKLLKGLHLPAVPGIGEKVRLGEGWDWRPYRVSDVTWQIISPEPGGPHRYNVHINVNPDPS